MNMIPKVKQMQMTNGVCHADGFSWHFAKHADARVTAYAYRISARGNVPVFVSHAEGDGEGYTLSVEKDKITVCGTGAAGAFYGLATLKMLWRSTGGEIACCEIADAPDMAYRGFYQDTTRGRIPTLDTLKALADTMADHKLNSLQLYIEHTYEFKEYAFCCELGYLTRAEIMELDAYCRERFIELVPSLSSFGHLYHLLQGEAYKHLCELENYTPTKWHYIERMQHHTINPTLDESFALITSLMEQHMEAFTSDKFNICCDETFDLGRGVNAGKDKGELYVGFVKKLVAYLEAKGKKVMMWGDIVLEHPDKLPLLPESITFLNWGYDADIEEARIAALASKKQIVCPGTSAWRGFHEYVDIEEQNIARLARFGKKYGACGVLNTNWGDIGNPASIAMAEYGLILGAAFAWNTETEVTDDLRRFISSYHYGCEEAIELLTLLGRASEGAYWLSHAWGYSRRGEGAAVAYATAQREMNAAIARIQSATFADPKWKREFLLAAEGDSLVLSWAAAREGYANDCHVAFERWLDDYRRAWLEASKPSELDTLAALFASEHARANSH